MNADPIDVTDILARPKEFARRYENMAAQLAQAQAERAAARAEVARLTAALHAYTDVYGTNLLLRGQPAPAGGEARP